MGFNIARFMAWEPTEADRMRAQAEWRGILVGLAAAKATADLERRLADLAEQKRLRKPRTGTKAWHFLQALVDNPDLPAARINAMLPVPMDESTARALAREWRGWV